MNEMTFDQAVAVLSTARDPRGVFGADRAEATRLYRRLARALHPDRVEVDRREAATRAFGRLARLWEQHTAGPTMRTGRAVYRLGPLAYAGDIANLYPAGDAYLKIPRAPRDNDLMEREARALRVLAEHGDPRFLPYVPRLVESFRHRDPHTGAQRRVNVLATVGGLRSLDDVWTAYPAGIDGRDAAWMWRRLLVALGLAHRAGVVHGAVLPEHVLIQPAEHGLVLTDWCYSVTAPDDRIPAIVTSRRDWYPREITAKAEPGPGTDIAMAARCMTHVMGDGAPRELRAFADGCALPALRQRPEDAWRLLAELDALLERLFGPRKFRPFTL